LRFKRNCRHFIGYINYEWEQDDEWTSFQEENMKDMSNAKQIEEVKREYYKKNMNARVDTSFVLETEEQKQEFLNLCKYVGTILSLNEVYKAKGAALMLCHGKHALYCLYALCLPLRHVMPCLTIFIIAHTLSTIQRSMFNKKKDSFLSLMLSCEESMHLFWLLTYMLLNWQLRIFVDFMFLIWALLNTCEWFDYLLMRRPGLPLIPLFSSLVQLMQDNVVDVIMFKNYIEVIIICTSLLSWMWAWCAPICGIVLIQALRIKFLGSNFTKEALRGIDGAVLSVMPDMIYNATVTPLKNWLSTLAGVKESI